MEIGFEWKKRERHLRHHQLFFLSCEMLRWWDFECYLEWGMIKPSQTLPPPSQTHIGNKDKVSNAKTSLNDMLISASFRYGQLKSIKNQSHPHLSFRYAHRSTRGREEGRVKTTQINWIKLQLRSGKVIMGWRNVFPLFCVQDESDFLIFPDSPRDRREKHRVAQFHP